MPETVTCNLCSEQDSKPLFARPDYRLGLYDTEWTLVKCRGCGLGYLNPRPTLEELARHYPAEYFDDRGNHGGRYHRLAAHVPNGTAGSLLDIGTARGDFPALMAERGWTVAGIEPFSDTNPHGLTIYRDDFPDECSAPAESFDVVTAWAVFEHLRDP